MSRDPSTRISAMVQTFDEGDGVILSVETHDRKQAFAIALDGDESADLQRTLSFDRDAVVLGLEDKLATARASVDKVVDAQVRTDAIANQYRVQAESAEERAEKAEMGLANAKAGWTHAAVRVEALVEENKRLQSRLAEVEAERDDIRTHGVTILQIGAERDAALARVKALEGDADPVQGVYIKNGLIYLGWRTDGEPLYRHPPKTGEPVAWKIKTSRQIEAAVSEPYAMRLQREGAVVTPLYEAPPPVALGVEGEEFAVRAVGEKDVCAFQWMNDHEVRDVGTRAETTQLARSMGPGATVVRVVPADAPVVDVAKIRDVCNTGIEGVKKFGKASLDVVLFFEEILAAIGEKG